MSKVKAYYDHSLSGLIASATTAGYSVDNLLIFLESSLWKGVGTGTHYINFDAGLNKTIGADYIGVANHNLSGSTFNLQYSAGATTGSDLVTNGGFDSATTGWTAVASTLASVAGGQSGNSLEVTNSGAASGSAYQDIGSLTVGDTYKIVAYFKKGTGVSGAIKVGTTTDDDYYGSDLGLTDAGWVAYTYYFTAIETTVRLTFVNESAVSAETALFDTASMYITSWSDAWDRNISEFATSVFDASATSPRGVSYSSDGTLWLADATTNKIYNIKTNGTLISSFATSVYDASATNISGISYSSDGTLWVTDLDTLKIYNIETDGTLISSFLTSVFDAGATFPTGISYVSDTLWICDAVTDKIYNIQTNGTLISSFATSVFDASATSPQDISYASDDTLWVVDATTDKIYNIQTDGTSILSFATSEIDAGATFPSGISHSSDGTLWICDATTDKVYNSIIYYPVDNNPFLKEFDLTYARFWRIQLTDLTSVPFMGIAYWGESSEWDYPVLFDPSAESDKAMVNISPTGYLLGINNKYIERSIDLKFKRADDGGTLWNALRSWWENHGLNLLFIAWDIENHPDDIYFVYPDPKFKGPFTTANRREVSLSFKGRVAR
jgi:sugar lactone lactonase YvrE